jgi:hypothetical protein
LEYSGINSIVGCFTKLKEKEKRNQERGNGIHPSHRQLIAPRKGDVSLAFDARDFFSELSDFVAFLEEITVYPEEVVEFEGGSEFAEGVGG